MLQQTETACMTDIPDSFVVENRSVFLKNRYRAEKTDRGWWMEWGIVLPFAGFHRVGSSYISPKQAEGLYHLFDVVPPHD